LSAPVAVTRQVESRPQVTSIEWIGPFGKPFRSYAVTKSSIDFSRLIVVLLAVNFLPAVLLWRHDEIAGWSERRKRDSATIPRNEMVDRARSRRGIVLFTCVLVALLLVVGFVAGLGIYNRLAPPPSKPKSDDLSQTSALGPVKSPPPATRAPTPSYSDLPPGFEVVSTPTPVRRAIPVAPESRP
jgi:hypothetical protein